MGSQTYDDVIEELLLLHPQRLTLAELARRAREPREPIDRLLAESRSRRRRAGLA